MAVPTPTDSTRSAEPPTHAPADPPIACTLTPDDFEERLAWIAALNRDALRSHRQDDGALTLVYAPEATARVRELVRREGECCAFLHFHVDETRDETRLTVRVPAHACDAADELLAPFRAGLPTAEPHA